MKHQLLSLLNNIIMIKIKGKNPERVLSYLYKMKIEMYKITYINHNEIAIKLKMDDYKKVEQIKTLNEITIIKYYGRAKIVHSFKKNIYLIISIILGYVLLTILSNVIFDVEVVHSNKHIRTLLTSELKKYGISKFNFKKDYDEIETIEEKILKENSDTLEWIEINEQGVKYIVNVEERKIINDKEEYIYQNIVAKKNAVLIKIEATSGVIVKEKNDYVKAGDVVISGDITQDGNLNNIIKADGKIFGEVWYNISVELPLSYHEEKMTGNKKNIYMIKLLGINLSLFDFHPYKYKKYTDDVILSHRLIPIKLVKETQYELEVIDKDYADNDAYVEALKLAEKKMQEQFDSNEEYIITYKTLNYYINDNKLYMTVFFKVCEDITSTAEIIIAKEE